MTSAQHDDDLAQVARPSESRNDPVLLRARLERWLATQLGPDAAPQVSEVTVPAANGMSSETVLFDAEWAESGTRTHHALVARIAPAPSAMPIFPSYDLGRQFETMRTVAAHSSVPVPHVYWAETTPDALGGEFFVMERIDGEVPPDVMPYTFGSWLTEASNTDRQRLQSASVQILAELHSIPLQHFDFLRTAGGSPLRSHVDEQRRYYDWVITSAPRSPLIERGFDWLEVHWPGVESAPTLCWGDARIGNIMYRDFTPAAVLDWEMAALGPPELDVAWMIFLHRFFQDLSDLAGLPGLPDFLRRDDVAAEYRERTGHAPADLDFYAFYAALRHAIIMYRVQTRAVFFGHGQATEDPDDMILHRATLEAMMAGTYWPGVDSGASA